MSIENAIVLGSLKPGDQWIFATAVKSILDGVDRTHPLAVYTVLEKSQHSCDCYSKYSEIAVIPVTEKVFQIEPCPERT